MLKVDLSYRLRYLSFADLVNFKMIFVSIVIEALPFILISVIVSAILHSFVSEEFISKVLPRNTFISIFLACFLGIIFPVCDCGTVPIARRLVMKKVPLPTAVAFMLAAPIINPIVTVATAYAFRPAYHMVYLRLLLGFFVAFSTSVLLSYLAKGNQLNNVFHYHSVDSTTPEMPLQEMTFTAKLKQMLFEASDEFFAMGKYLIFGALLGAFFQAALSRAVIMVIGHDSFMSITFMMLFAYFISVCSSADAFIARSFNTNFTVGSLQAFMVLGPMLDFKNTLMLFHAFKPRFVLLLIVTTTAMCAGGAYFINLLGVR